MNVWKNWLTDLLVFLIFILGDYAAGAQPKQEDESFSVLFYNVENLFDTQDDPMTGDDEFCPGGMRNWNYFRLKAKLNKLSKVIAAASGFNVPAIVGVCEIENRWVLEQLTQKTILRRFNYRIIHKDSPDKRGIDVAILYRPDLVTPLNYRYHPLVTNGGDTLPSREILEAAFQYAGDTLHVFINHWPSRYRGQAETESDRLLAAQTLRNAVWAIYKQYAKAKVVITGDFNDQPENASLRSGLHAVSADDPMAEGELVNLSGNRQPGGTLKHQNSWQVFDQIIVSDYLLKGTKLYTSPSDARIVDLPFLFEEDDRWGGKRLFRTYRGYKYAGGFSDHLPVLLKLYYSD
jgi:endonuclease/exonuclease/phosphatase family metal-dependent hydrolase